MYLCIQGELIKCHNLGLMMLFLASNDNIRIEGIRQEPCLIFFREVTFDLSKSIFPIIMEIWWYLSASGELSPAKWIIVFLCTITWDSLQVDSFPKIVSFAGSFSWKCQSLYPACSRPKRKSFNFPRSLNYGDRSFASE